MKPLNMIAIIAVAAFALLVPVTSAFATAQPGFGQLYYNGTIVGTVVPPSAFPNQGIDNFYKVTNGASDQLGIASVAPGNTDYHGGHWKVFTVTFKLSVTPTLLTSEQAVLAAENAGTVTATRVASADFLCPIQP